MVDVVRTCANCGNTQTVGDFCEKCGTRMPAAAAPAASPAASPPPGAAPAAAAPVAAAAAYTAARAATPPPTTPPPTAPPSYSAPQHGAAPQYGAEPQYGMQGQYGAPAPGGAAQYGYARDRSGWGKLFDFSFQGFVTEGTLKTLYIINLAAIGLFVLFQIIYVAMAGNRYTVIQFFIWLFAAVFWFFLSRIIFELMATAMRIRDREGK
ncbi:MAG: DUF4282 domain-containing protein [Armatimonadetes bacterium]|nr:DUF4282 domain-containing protein [Armatimonadota bacterium]